MHEHKSGKKSVPDYIREARQFRKDTYLPERIAIVTSPDNGLKRKNKIVTQKISRKTYFSAGKTENHKNTRIQRNSLAIELWCVKERRKVMKLRRRVLN